MPRTIWTMALLSALTLPALWAQAAEPTTPAPETVAAAPPASGPWWQTPELTALHQQAREACAELYRLELATPGDEAAIAQQRAEWAAARQAYWTLRDQLRPIVAPAASARPAFGRGAGAGRGWRGGAGCGQGRGWGRGCAGANPDCPYQPGS